MRHIRRSPWEHRLEMTPMIDVIFLLLTFFVYSMVMMIHAEVLPVRLTPVSTGTQTAPGSSGSGEVQAITIDKQGRVFLNRREMTFEQFDARLAEIAKDPSKPRVFVAMELEGQTDRGPLLVNLVERLRAAGIYDWALVGPPRAGTRGSEGGDVSDVEGEQD
jgi:biopolymer transport protein ExbD